MKPNWANRTLWTGDNLDIMRGMASESVDLIYLDPPFNSNRNYGVPIEGSGVEQAFKDTWTLDQADENWLGSIANRAPALYRVVAAAGESHSDGMQAYLTMMAVRLLEMHRLLKETGSIYLHCDPTASHYLKLLMDAVFGRDHYRNEIIWCYKASNSPIRNGYHSKHDVLLFYTKSDDFTFHRQYMSYNQSYLDQTYRYVDEDGRSYRKHSKRKDGSERRLYLDEAKGVPVLSWWTDIIGFGTATQSAERTGYPTQKPLALLRRVISASSNEGDVVLDPFCGCSTACVAAEELRRRWVGIDLSPLAKELIKERFSTNLGLFTKALRDTHFRDDIPPPFLPDDDETTAATSAHPKHYKKRQNKEHLFGKQRGVCPTCRREYAYKNLEIDHKVPRAKGGSDALDNLQLLCGRCNRLKGAKSMEEFVRDMLEENRLEWRKAEQYFQTLS